ncbi:hypothetical protein FSP39_006319 [Pinctada imbricata]|uniref:G-protein coupled receptors family 1 profile domain-containing protein n=1 Tax=Pinctada imbricata TaxID=66713 RepID=A0AA89CAK7_PINIB|nr:hypothetical protein FSP39_006319 [Pinctada imbricata]
MCNEGVDRMKGRRRKGREEGRGKRGGRGRERGGRREEAVGGVDKGRVKRRRREEGREGEVLKMLLMVVVMFGLCWLPLHVFNVIINFRPELADDKHHDRGDNSLLAVYLTTHWLAMSNSFANPVIYSFTNDSFRVRILIQLAWTQKGWGWRGGGLKN